MYRKKKFSVWASEIAGYLNKKLEGDDFLIDDFCSLKTPETISRGRRQETDCGRKTLLLAPKREPGGGWDGFIASSSPDLDLAYVLREFFASAPVNRIHPTAIVSEDAKLGRNVMIGAYSYIGPDVDIAESTMIFEHVVIHGPARIGRYCVIKDGAVIGSEGWGFIKDEDGVPFHPPQLGEILIEDKVWIGSHATIERAMIEETRIGHDVKIDDLVHIGGGSLIGAKSEVTAHVVIAHRVNIGQNVHIAPSAVIRNDLHIADDVLIGLGATVVKDIDKPGVYIGNPARFMKERPANGEGR